MHLSALKKARKHALKTSQLVNFLVEHGLALPPTKQSLIEPAWKRHGSLMETSHLYFYYTTETLLFSPSVDPLLA